MSLTKNYKELFEMPDEESKEWDNKLLELGKEGNVKKFEKHAKTARKMYINERQILTAISEYTKNIIAKEEKEKLLTDLLKSGIAIDVQINDSNVIIETKDVLINFRKLSDAVSQFKEDNDIETQNRAGKCHIKSLEICKKLTIPNEIVTGYVFGYSDKAKYLHSWVEYSSCGQEYVIDYTRNIVINKEGYYRIMNAIPLSRISNKTIKEDEKILLNLPESSKISLKEYFVFRDEMMKDLRKNKEIFEEER